MLSKFNKVTTMTKTKKKNHYVDNEKFLAEIKIHKQKCKDAAAAGKEKPRLSDYIGKCIYLIAENLSHKPRFMNYSFRDEMISDAIENCFMYFDNFDSDKYSNPFAYFTQIIYYAFHRRINKEEKNRYIMYKKFQEGVLETNDANLMFDGDGNNLVTHVMYDNLNEFIRKFEEREKAKKEKRKEKKEGLEKFVENEDENEGRNDQCTDSGNALD
jgi:hypothetical protein